MMRHRYNVKLRRQRDARMSASLRSSVDSPPASKSRPNGEPASTDDGLDAIEVGASGISILADVV
jgi:hypothetical protein